MEVILKEDVAKLGARGEVVSVAEGYGRNYLLPKKLAVPADERGRHVLPQPGRLWRRRADRAVHRHQGDRPHAFAVGLGRHDMRDIVMGAVRASVVTWLLCGLAYPLALTGLGQWLMPFQANGSLERNPDGAVIGSRLKRSGMFWSVRGANAIIALRCCRHSRRFDDYWEHRRS